jgi:hypothetical protein
MRHLYAAEGLLDSGWIKIIKASTGSPSKKNLPGVPVLNEKNTMGGIQRRC